MAKFAVIFFAALAFHASLAAPKGETSNTLEDVAKQIESAANELSTSFQKALDPKILKAQSQEFKQNVESIVGKLQAEIEKNKGKSNDLLKQASDSLGQTLKSLEDLTGPENAAKMSEFKTKFEADVKGAADQFEKLGKDIQPQLQQAGDSVGTFFKGVFDDFLKATEELKTNVEKAASKN